MRFQKTLITLTLVASLFTDPSIASKYLGVPPGGYVLVVLSLVVFQILVLLSRRSFRVARQARQVGVVLMLYAIMSMSYRILAGQAIGDLSLQAVVVANAFLLLLVMSDRAFQHTMMTAIVIAGFVHLFTLFPDPFGLRSRLISATAYGLGAGGLSDFRRRETGLFPAPAMLVAFSIALFVVAFFQFSSDRRKFWPVVSMTVALALGVSTFNRSFLVGLAFALIILSWVNGIRTRLLMLYAVAAAVLYFIPLGEYFDFVGERFTALLARGVDGSQRWTGSNGILTGISTFLDHPLFGSPVAPDGGTLQAITDSQEIVNPHNGLALVLATFGLIGGAPLLVLYGVSTITAVRILAVARRSMSRLRVVDSQLRLQTITALVSVSLIPVLLVEPLPEYGLILLLSIAPLLARLTPFVPHEAFRRTTPPTTHRSR